ncbi:MAG TPA: hypothetical protein VI318_06475 [Baekduia sp.]
MFTISQLTRTSATAATIATLGTTSVAVARPVDGPLRPDRPTVVAPAARSASPWTQPRTESPGVRPAQPLTTSAAAAPAVPLTRADESGTDWLPVAAVVSAAILLLLLAVGLVQGGHSLTHPFRHPRV